MTAEVKPTNCHYCGYCCAFLATVEDGRVTDLAPDPSRYPYDERILAGCRRWRMNLDALDGPDRVNYPLRRAGERGEGSSTGDGKLEQPRLLAVPVLYRDHIGFWRGVQSDLLLLEAGDGETGESGGEVADGIRVQADGAADREGEKDRGDAEVEGAAPYLAGDAGGDEQDDRDPHGAQAAPWSETTLPTLESSSLSGRIG